MRGGRQEIEREVAGLADLPREELVQQWHKIYGVQPPKGVRHDLLIRAAAWHLQAKRLGGLSAETRRLLRSAIGKVESEMLSRDKRSDTGIGDQRKVLGDGTDVDLQNSAYGVTSSARSRRPLTPGTRLMRDWNGKTHVVDVIETGFVFQAKVYPSLTAIAYQITAAHWSGPRFFGL